MSDDPWHYPRADLAQTLFDQFDTRLSQAAILFGPRRTGKTEFLLKDLGPLAQANGWRVAYASLWQSRLSPLAVLLHALASSQRGTLVDRLENLARSARPKLKLGAGDPSGSMKGELEIDLTALRAPPTSDQLLLLDEHLGRFASGQRRGLLLIDEAQELATDEDNRALVAALRTSLDKRRDTLATLFTGSSQDSLRRMFAERDAPFFHFGTNVPWPPMDDGFVDHMVDTFAQIVRAKLDRKACLAAFRRLDRNPYMFRKLLELLAFDPERDVGGALDKLTVRIAEEHGYPDIWRGLSPLHRVVAHVLADKPEGPFSQATLAKIAEMLGGTQPSRAQVLAAIRHLIRAGILDRSDQRGQYDFEDKEFARWILDQHA